VKQTLLWLILVFSAAAASAQTVDLVCVWTHAKRSLTDTMNIKIDTVSKKIQITNSPLLIVSNVVISETEYKFSTKPKDGLQTHYIINRTTAKMKADIAGRRDAIEYDCQRAEVKI
jgi:hypothetical protein